MSTYDNVGRKDFLQCVRESKENSQLEKKEYKRVSKKKIIKQRLAQLYVTGVYSNRQIADILAVNVNTVRKMLKQQDVIDMINDYQNIEKESIDQKLKALRDRATDTLSDLLNSDEDAVRLQAVKTILDKTGHGDKKEIENNINISYEERLRGVIDNVSFNVEDLEYLPGSENND